MPHTPDQHRLVSRFQRRHFIDNQWNLLILPVLLYTPSLAPLHWLYQRIKSYASRKYGYEVGSIQTSRSTGYCYPATPTTAVSMNYSLLVFGGVVLFRIANYITFAHKSYIGPLVEAEMN